MLRRSQCEGFGGSHRMHRSWIGAVRLFSIRIPRTCISFAVHRYYFGQFDLFASDSPARRDCHFVQTRVGSNRTPPSIGPKVTIFGFGLSEQVSPHRDSNNTCASRLLQQGGSRQSHHSLTASRRAFNQHTTRRWHGSPVCLFDTRKHFDRRFDDPFLVGPGPADR